MNTMLEDFFTIKGTDLTDVLGRGREYLLEHGKPASSSRGKTFSARCVKLVWENPDCSAKNFWRWSSEETETYLSTFVDKKDANAPEHLAQSGDLLFPYTYAARSRFWDGGWGYVAAVVQATLQIESDTSEICKNFDSFLSYLINAGQLVHLQVVLSVWDWLGKGQIESFLQSPEIAPKAMKRSRLDQLDVILKEIQSNPGSRRAITASFIYPVIDQRFDPIISIPPYQNFQILPTDDAQAELHSLHYHRSLDALSGVQLDFHHDLAWLQYISQKSGREIGSISIITGDFHTYANLNENLAGESDQSEVVDWLLRVTDGYRSRKESVEKLLQNPIYIANAKTIFNRIGD